MLGREIGDLIEFKNGILLRPQDDKERLVDKH
jgi:hypothetical protein